MPPNDAGACQSAQSRGRSPAMSRMSWSSAASSQSAASRRQPSKPCNYTAATPRAAPYAAQATRRPPGSSTEARAVLDFHYIQQVASAPHHNNGQNAYRPPCALHEEAAAYPGGAAAADVAHRRNMWAQPIGATTAHAPLCGHPRRCVILQRSSAPRPIRGNPIMGLPASPPGGAVPVPSHGVPAHGGANADVDGRRYLVLRRRELPCPSAGWTALLKRPRPPWGSRVCASTGPGRERTIMAPIATGGSRRPRWPALGYVRPSRPTAAGRRQVVACAIRQPPCASLGPGRTLRRPRPGPGCSLGLRAPGEWSQRRLGMA